MSLPAASPSPSRPSRWLALGVFVTCVLSGAAAVLSWDARTRSVRSEEALARIESGIDGVKKTLELARLEGATGTTGVQAFVKRLKVAAPRLQNVAYSAEVEITQQRIREGLEAMAALGSDAFADLQGAFEAADLQRDAEVRKWLLKAMVRCDPEAAKAYLGSILDLDVVTSPRVRLIAADELLQLDKPTAGRLLRKILTRESSQDVTAFRDRLPASEVDKYVQAYQQTGRYQGFYNYVSRYVASQDEQMDSTLLMVLGRQDQDVATIQACVRYLAERKSKLAVTKLQDMFERPPIRFANSLLRQKLARAVCEILGTESCDWLNRRVAEEKDDLVRRELAGQRAKLCK